jgi:nucleolar complex protein 2
LQDEDDGIAHLQELSKLAEKDPEFYKYLQENDQELLNFKPNETEVVLSDEEMEEGIPSDEEEEATPVLKAEILKGWQKALLEVRGLKIYLLILTCR